MQFSNYADFRNKFHQMFDGDDISTSDISGNVLDLIIGAGEQRVYRDIRSTTQEATLLITTANNFAPVPSDFLELKDNLYLGNGFAVATYAPWEYVQNHIQQNVSTMTSAPRVFTTQSDQFLFYPPQPDGTTVNGTYYRRFPDLSTGLNALFTRHPDVFLYASLAECGPFLGEMTRGPAWEQKYTSLVASANEQERRRMTRGSKLQTRRG